MGLCSEEPQKRPGLPHQPPAPSGHSLMSTFSAMRASDCTFADHSEKLVKDRWKIAYHYAVTWFIIDFVAAIPFDYIQLGSDSTEVNANGGSSDVDSVQLLKVQGLYSSPKAHLRANRI